MDYAMTTTAKTRGRRRVAVGALTPNQMAERFIQLSKEWHRLARQEIAETNVQRPPALVDVLGYDEWARGVMKSPADVIVQADTLKRFDQWRDLYGQHRARVASVIGKEPAALPLEKFDRARGGLFGNMPWWGWLIALGLGYLLVREFGRNSK